MTFLLYSELCLLFLHSANEMIENKVQIIVTLCGSIPTVNPPRYACYSRNILIMKRKE